MPKSKPTARTTATAPSAPKAAAKPPAKATTRGATRSAKTSAVARARAKVRAGAPRLSDSEIDLTPVRIVDDRRFSGKFQIVEDEGEKRVLGWGFPSVQAARRWIENRNHLSAWLRFIVRGE